MDEFQNTSPWSGAPDLAWREKFSAAAGSNLTGSTMLGTLKYPVAPSLIFNPARQSN
jgi:hypothetical protein